ncbi:MAG: Por secretion system protein [Bacteroidaceae bacterium]|nr:Por secretion system protein [Bacteroidaceae bacterium]
MKKRTFTLLLFVFLSLSWLVAAIGDWTVYNSYRYATSCRTVGDRVYVLSAGNLYSYDKEDNELRVFDHINALSDVKVACIEYSNAIEALVVVYENANVDILYDNETIYNISDFKNKVLADKQINNVQVADSMAYISTSFGIVELNLKRLEFGNTYTLNRSVQSVALYDGYLFACTPTGLFRGSLGDNLLDYKNWKQLLKYNVVALGEYKGELYGILRDFGFYSFDTEGHFVQQIKNDDKGKFSYMQVDGDRMIVGNASRVCVYDSPDAYAQYTLFGNSLYLHADGKDFWSCNGADGLARLTLKDGKLHEALAGVQPNSPIRSYCEYLDFSKTGNLLVAGGNLNYFDDTFYDGTAMMFDGSKWLNFQEKEIKDATGLFYQNITSIVEDPYEEGHYFASSFGYGLYEFRDGKFVKHYNHENSALRSVISSGYVNRYVRVPRLKYDADGNLWMTNTGTQDIIKVLKRDGSWLTLPYKDISKSPTMVDILFDSRGWLWVTSLQADAGLFCAKMNNTPLDTSDDETKFVSGRLKNQDGINYEISQLYTLVEDRTGQMWMGTNLGLFVLPNPKKFFDGSVTFNQIKVPRNDGTGLADYLLSNVAIQTIYVDGANRKWVGTKDSGLYLVSADGLETIHHFTTENSPLPSNSIVSIAVNEESGEVFIGTTAGLVSYMGDATEPATTLDENSLHAYPNPVREDYTGDISVTGFTQDCNVKIIDSAGTLIYETSSTGGQITWNGCNVRGERVSAGVYYVLAYDATGDKGAATKILVIR